jgi:glycosyltransferase involved in cell wall biosynthesis
MMKRKFFISAIYTSPPTTMGGNTKIMIEIINNLCDKYDFVIITTEPDTFRENLSQPEKVTIQTVPYPFKKFNYLSHHKEIVYMERYLSDFFSMHQVSSQDYFYSCIDFAPDVLPIIRLKKKYPFIWIATLYLFIPAPWENIVHNYQFPFIKYIIYYLYQRFIFQKILQHGDLFIITNDYDRKFFPKKLQKCIFAIYGGVNSEQIVSAQRNHNSSRVYDAVFCSRLHPQKGISQLLDIWHDVYKSTSNAKLAIIGNGEPSYEKFLKEKAETLGLKNNIVWLGYVNNIDKYKVYLKSRFLVHATVYDNNGMVAAEALSSGLPVVLYDLPQLREVYTTGCVKIPERDQRKFTEVIVKLLKDTEYYDSMKPNKKEMLKIRDYWEWQNRSQQLHSFLKNNENLT